MKATLQPHTPYAPRITYPRLMVHEISGCVILMTDADGGFVIANPQEHASWGNEPTKIGAIWRARKPFNYAPFLGSILLEND